MSGVAIHQETHIVSESHIWRLVALVQAATLRLFDEETRDLAEQASAEFSLALVENPFLAGLDRLKDNQSETVALHHRVVDSSPVEILKKALLAIENGEAGASGSIRRYPDATHFLSGSIHRYLREAIRSEGQLRCSEKKLRQSMYQFAYGLSHEINNPLANISARASELASRMNGDREKKSLKTIVDQAMKAHEMLAEMMLAVQLPSLVMITGDLRSLMLDISQPWEKQTESQGIRWVSEICDDFLWSIFDAGSLSEAISAAIRNSVEACRSGDAISLVAERTESLSGELEIRVAVIDNGPGLSPMGLEQAWNLYFSGREAGRGLGIGLSKVKRIIEAHHGRVWLASKEQQGCTLEIRLPWKRASSVA